jgi:hypothetical protein
MSTSLTYALAVAGLANLADSASRAGEQRSQKTRVCRYFSGTGIYNSFHRKYFYWLRVLLFAYAKCVAQHGLWIK